MTHMAINELHMPDSTEFRVTTTSGGAIPLCIERQRASIASDVTNNNGTRQNSAGFRAMRDELLIQRIRAGETDLFEELIRPYLCVAFALVRPVVRDHADAEDAVQQSVLRAFSNLPKLRSACSFRAWFIQIAINEARMMRRRNARRRLDVPVDQADLDATPHSRRWVPARWQELPSTRLLREELRARIRKAVEDLPSKHREVVVLRDLAEQNTQETARALGVTVATVKARLHRARIQLRASLGPILSQHSHNSEANCFYPSGLPA